MSSQWGHLRPENNFQKACVEFVESERSYVDSLGEMSMMYYWPLMSCFGVTVVKFPSPCPSFTAEQGKVLFGNLMQIVHVSQQFLEKMQKDGPAAILSGEALRNQMGELIPLLKHYIEYCSGFTASSSLLSRLLQDQPDFKTFESQCQRKTHNPLGFYLIMPVQRVPRYKLLLATLITEAERHNAQVKNGVSPKVLEAFQEAFQKVSNVANQINEQLRENENALEIATLSESFVEDPGFTKAGRCLLKRESVSYQKQGALLLLFNDHVALAAKQQGIHSIKALSGASLHALSPLQSRYKLVNQIVLDHAFKLTLDSTDPKTFTIISSQKYWVIEFETADKRTEWQKLLEEGKTRKINKHRGSRLVSMSLPNRPVLKPKASAVVCGLCKSKFNVVFKRAKNCMLCGELFCTDCSMSRVQQPPNPKLVRACDSCASVVLRESENKKFEEMRERGRMSEMSPPERGRMSETVLPSRGRPAEPTPARERTHSEPANNRYPPVRPAGTPPLPLPIPRAHSISNNPSTGVVQSTLSPIVRANPSVAVAPLFSLTNESQTTSPAHVLRERSPAPPLRTPSGLSHPGPTSPSSQSSLLSPSNLSAVSSPSGSVRAYSPSPDARAGRSISQTDMHIRTASPPPRVPPQVPLRHVQSPERSNASSLTTPPSRPTDNSAVSRLVHEANKSPQSGYIPPVPSRPPEVPSADTKTHNSPPERAISPPGRIGETGGTRPTPGGFQTTSSQRGPAQFRPPEGFISHPQNMPSGPSRATTLSPDKFHESSRPVITVAPHSPPKQRAGSPPLSYRSLPASAFSTSNSTTLAPSMRSPSPSPTPPSSSQRSASAAPPASFRSVSPSPTPTPRPQPSNSHVVAGAAKMLEQKLGSGAPMRARALSADFVRPSHRSQ